MINIISVLSTILLFNCILIFVVWNKYSKRIQALIYRKSSKDIVFGKKKSKFAVVCLLIFRINLSEKLRKEVTDLRLPKEHSPRI